MWLDRLETSFKINLKDCFIVTEDAKGYLRVNLHELQAFLRAKQPPTGNVTELERFVNCVFFGKTRF